MISLVRGYEVYGLVPVIRPILEYGAEIWNGGLTQEQKKGIERIQKRVLRIIYPNLDYDQAITETKLQTLEERSDELCVSLIKKMLNSKMLTNHPWGHHNSSRSLINTDAWSLSL